MKTLFAGPFIGELGFEMFEWQGYIRKLSEQYDRTIVASRPKNELLYKDFCHEFIPYDPESFNCAGWTNYDHTYRGKLHENYNADKIIFIDNEGDARELLEGLEQKFIPFGVMSEPKNEIVIHARMIRARDSYKISRNWHRTKWQNVADGLMDRGITVCSSGITGCAEYIRNTKNYMNVGLDRLADILVNAKMIVGPSSGPMHFASLCCCPQFVWSSDQPGIGMGNRENYKKKWNPFETKVCMYEEGGWDPSPEEILDAVLKFYETL